MKPRRNKNLFGLLIATLSFSSCGLLSSSPSSVVKELISDTQKGDVDAAVSLWAEAAVKERGMDEIRKNAQDAVEFDAKVRAAGEHLQIENLREAVQGDRARVFFFYRDRSKNDSMGVGFALLKENGKWNLSRFGHQRRREAV